MHTGAHTIGTVVESSYSITDHATGLREVTLDESEVKSVYCNHPSQGNSANY